MAWHTEHHVAANCSPLRTSALPLLAPHKAIRMNTGKGVIARKLMRQHYNRHSPDSHGFEARIAPLTRLLQRQTARRRESGDRIRRRANGRNRVRRETGKEQMVRVHYDEGVAIHIGPESCAGGREAVREALTGECAGQPLSHEKVDIPGADAVRYAEGHTKGRAIASSPTTRRGRRPWHVQTLFVREPGGLVVDQGGMPRLVRIGKARSRSR